MTLDLHGVKHENVSRLIDSFIFVNMQRNESRAYVITGNSSDMKRIVKEIVCDHGFEAIEHINNPATLIIDFI